MGSLFRVALYVFCFFCHLMLVADAEDILIEPLEDEMIVDDFPTAYELDQEQLENPPEVFFSITPQNQNLSAGEDLSLECYATGIPPPTVHWTFKGQLVDQGPHEADDNLIEKLLNVGRTTIESGITVSKLKVPCVGKRNQGDYVCVAFNGHETIQAQAAVTVTGKSRGCVVNRLLSDQPMKKALKHNRLSMRTDNNKKQTPPAIFMFTDGRFERCGASVQLFCRASGNPQPKISWFNERNQILQTDDIYQLLDNGDLLIKDTRQAELVAGVYTCLATNELGSDQAQPFLYVTRPEQTDDETEDFDAIV